MAALTKNRKTSERIPAVRQFEAAAKIFTGALVAINASGKAVPASDEDGLTVAGRAENSAVSGEMVTVKSGCFRYDNASGGASITAADVGKVATSRTIIRSGNPPRTAFPPGSSSMWKAKASGWISFRLWIPTPTPLTAPPLPIRSVWSNRPPPWPTPPAKP